MDVVPSTPDDSYGKANHVSGDSQYEISSAWSKYHPRDWGLKTKIVIVIGVVIVVVAVIVGAVLGTRANRYPAYSKLTYTIKDTYQGTNFFSNFDYFTRYDPSAGFVHYVDAAGSSASELNLTYALSTSAILLVDTTEKDATTGRKSARIMSKNQYHDGPFLFDILHVPFGCATWPAVWLSGPMATWPEDGEIDVFEVTNLQSGSQSTLHTTDGCNMNVKRKETGTVLATDCLNSTNNNADCGVQGPSNTAGQSLADGGGGVYAMELRDDGIRIWFFARPLIPSDITAGIAPDPSSWGTALADFPSTECSIGQHFRNQSVIVNIDLCGSWVGSESVYSGQYNCPGLCTDYVAKNAAAFEDAYFQFSYFKVFQASS